MEGENHFLTLNTFPVNITLLQFHFRVEFSMIDETTNHPKVQFRCTFKKFRLDIQFCCPELLFSSVVRVHLVDNKHSVLIVPEGVDQSIVGFWRLMS